MGLRLLAHYFDRQEALIVSALLDAEEILNFIHTYEMASVQAWYEFAFGGYRVMVREEDLAAAIEVVQHARTNPVTQGEQLVTHYHIAFPLAAILTFVFGGWILFMPYRSYSWRTSGDSHEDASES